MARGPQGGRGGTPRYRENFCLSGLPPKPAALLGKVLRAYMTARLSLHRRHAQRIAMIEDPSTAPRAAENSPRVAMDAHDGAVLEASPGPVTVAHDRRAAKSAHGAMHRTGIKSHLRSVPERLDDVDGMPEAVSS